MPESNPPRNTVGNFRDLFTEDEIRDGLSRVLPQDIAEATVRSMYADVAANSEGYGDLLSALSLVSPDCAARVRSYLGEGEAAEAERLTEFRRRVRLR